MKFEIEIIKEKDKMTCKFILFYIDCLDLGVYDGK